MCIYRYVYVYINIHVFIHTYMYKYDLAYTTNCSDFFAIVAQYSQTDIPRSAK